MSDCYIYNADIYCEECGRAIRKRIRKEGNAPKNPKDEYSYDSGEYPKGPYTDGGGEADHPQHCGSGDECLDAIYGEDANGNPEPHYGKFLENPLTTDGYEYVKESHRDNPSEITQLWMDFYGVSSCVI